jgi:NarL family two-component system response regulator YdfI
MTRVLVAAASAVTRAGLEAILTREPGFAIVGNGGQLVSVVEEVAALEPDVVLVEMAGHGSEDAAGLLRLLSVDADEAARVAPAVVVLTDDDDGAHIAELLDADVRAILPRHAGAVEVIAAVVAASAGLIVVAPELMRGARRAVSRTAQNGASLLVQPLTTREVEVLRMLAEGLANKQIAGRLAISEHTVKFHVGSVFAKIGASTRAEAVMIGARRGLIVL